MKNILKNFFIGICFCLSLCLISCKDNARENEIKSENNTGQENIQGENLSAKEDLNIQNKNSNILKDEEETIRESQTDDKEYYEIDYKDLKSWEKESEDYNESEDGKVLEAYEVIFKVPNLDTYHIIKNYRTDINEQTYAGDLTLKETRERREENSDKREFLVTYVGELNKAE